MTVGKTLCEWLAGKGLYEVCKDVNIILRCEHYIKILKDKK